MKKVHFIGVAGSAIAPIAIMMKENGWEVTGSDEGVFEPARSLLTEHQVNWYEGYDPIRVEDADLVILGGGPLMKDPNNPEFLRAKQLGKQIEGYAYLLGKYVVKEKSVVVTGSYGKTSTTGLLSWILDSAGMDPSFMIGGKPVNFDTGVRSTDSKISCIEGDEFLSVYGYDNLPRFMHYAPTHTIISAAQWDHVNVYPTEESYIEAFYKLLDLTFGNEGKIFLSLAGRNNDKLLARIAEQGHMERVVTYMVDGDLNQTTLTPQYTAQIRESDKDGFSFTLLHNGEMIGEFHTQLIGRHNVENCLAAICVALDLGISVEQIAEGVSTYKGIKRRLEIVGKNSKGATIIDDFAHSAMKAEASLDALRATYPEKKIVAVYFPRQSARENREELSFYKGAFDKADQVYIPRITVKKSTPKDQRIYGKDILNAIAITQPNVEYVPKEENLINRLLEKSSPDTIILFMSASGWGEVMEEVKK